MSKPEKNTATLLLCPFCGGHPVMEHWHGGGPQKRAIHCDNESCVVNPMTTGSTKARAIVNWNFRRPA